MSDTGSDGVLDELDGVVRFTQRPSLIPAAARAPWRISLVCLVISRFRQQSARINHLHLINWALTASKTRAQLNVWLAGTRPMDTATARLDPALEVTLSIARAAGLVTVTGSQKIALTDLGKQLVAELDANDNVLGVEKAYLASLGQLTEAGLTRKLGAIAG
jgi:hypothetical protein